MKGLTGKIAGLAGIALLGLGLSTAALAQTTAPVDVNIDNDPNAAVTATIGQAEPFEALPYSNTDQTTTGVLTITVTDTRGTAEGWSLYLNGTSDFTGATTGQTIPLGNLSIASGTVQFVAGQASPLPTGASIASVTTSPQPVLTAAAESGSGSYSMLSTASLLIPGGTLVDTYRTTITVGFNASP